MLSSCSDTLILDTLKLVDLSETDIVNLGGRHTSWRDHQESSGASITTDAIVSIAVFCTAMLIQFWLLTLVKASPTQCRQFQDLSVLLIGVVLIVYWIVSLFCPWVLPTATFFTNGVDTYDQKLPGLEVYVV